MIWIMLISFSMLSAFAKREETIILLFIINGVKIVFCSLSVSLVIPSRLTSIHIHILIELNDCSVAGLVFVCAASNGQSTCFWYVGSVCVCVFAVRSQLNGSVKSSSTSFSHDASLLSPAIHSTTKIDTFARIWGGTIYIYINIQKERKNTFLFHLIINLIADIYVLLRTDDKQLAVYGSGISGRFWDDDVFIINVYIHFWTCIACGDMA